jgi:hypothetical protein
MLSRQASAPRKDAVSAPGGPFADVNGFNVHGDGKGYRVLAPRGLYSTNTFVCIGVSRCHWCCTARHFGISDIADAYEYETRMPPLVAAIRIASEHRADEKRKFIKTTSSVL